MEKIRTEAIKITMDNKGQAIVEATAASVVTILAVSGLFFLALLVLVKTLSQRILYEAMICNQLLPKVYDCRWQAEKKLKNIRMGSKLISFYLTESTSEGHAIAHFELPLHYKLKIEDTLKLPLIDVENHR